MNEQEHERLRRIMGLDQAAEEFKSTGSLIYAHFTAFCDAGFTRKQAFDLTQQFYEKVLIRQLEGTK